MSQKHGHFLCKSQNSYLWFKTIGKFDKKFLLSFQSSFRVRQCAAPFSFQPEYISSYVLDVGPAFLPLVFQIEESKMLFHIFWSFHWHLLQQAMSGSCDTKEWDRYLPVFCGIWLIYCFILTNQYFMLSCTTDLVHIYRCVVENRVKYWLKK